MWRSMKAAMRVFSSRTVGDRSKSIRSSVWGVRPRLRRGAPASPGWWSGALREAELLLPLGADTRGVPGGIPDDLDGDVLLPQRGDPLPHLLGDGARRGAAFRREGHP